MPSGFSCVWRRPFEGVASSLIDAALAPLRDALTREKAALTTSLDASAHALRQPDAHAISRLAAAHADVEAQIVALRGRDDLSADDVQRTDDYVAALGARRSLVDAQLRIEAWIADWRSAAVPSVVGAGQPRPLH